MLRWLELRQEYGIPVFVVYVQQVAVVAFFTIFQLTITMCAYKYVWKGRWGISPTAYTEHPMAPFLGGAARRGTGVGFAMNRTVFVGGAIGLFQP